MKQKIIITGITGYIGENLAKFLMNEYDVIGIINKTNTNIITPTIKLDLKSNNYNSIKEFNPDIIIHCAAISGLKACEENKNNAKETNVNVTRKITKLANDCSARLIFISSDQVFDGKKGMYSEGEIKNPVNYYGETKSEAEEIEKNNCLNYAVCRTALVYGGLKEKEGSFWNYLYTSLIKNKAITLYNNIFSNPTHIDELCLMIKRLIGKKENGIFHCVGNQKLSRYEFGLKVAKKINKDSNLIKSENWIKGSQCRPKDSSLIPSSIFNGINTNNWLNNNCEVELNEN